MADDEIEKQRLLAEFERASFQADELIRHPGPIPLPAEVLEAAPVPARREAGQRFRLLQGLPTLIVLAFACAWTVAGYDRHDMTAYALGLAFTVGAIVSGWGSATRAL